jgi:S-DNA-T family DNA segregation ATPase FtsK/SpoIIIE
MPHQHKGGMSLRFLVGHSAEGPTYADLETLPHLLVAGTTGSGKSVFLHSMLCDLLTGSDARFILIDPKRVEFSFYKGSARLVRPPLTDMDDAATALRWAKMNMDMRFRLLEANNLRDWGDLKVGSSRIVIVVDEMANLLLTHPEVERPLSEIAMMGRAAGIHLVLATQRPSADVLTGLIRTNIPARVALTVSTAVESRIIIDTTGAEDLKGHGDMLYRNGARLIHLSGRYVPDKQIIAIARGT